MQFVTGLERQRLSHVAPLALGVYARTLRFKLESATEK
jgi:hypothetical protein